MSVLRVSDRCDRCQAQAFVHVEVDNGVLLFCGHHYRKHEPALLERGARIIDERHRINEKPTDPGTEPPKPRGMVTL